MNPSYFEMALFSSMAGKIAEHKLVNYRVGMAQFIKAQVGARVKDSARSTLSVSLLVFSFFS